MREPAVRLAPGERGAVLQGIGVSRLEESVYVALLESPRVTEADLATRLDLSAGEVRAALEALEGFGLVSRLADAERTIVLAPAGPAIEALVLRRRHEADEALLAAARYAEVQAEHQLAESGGDMVELITGRDAVAARFAQLQLGARTSMRVLDTPPYIAVRDDAHNQAELDVLGRGVACRVVYDPEALSAPLAIEQIRRTVAAGELARLAHEPLPTKLVVVDDTFALLPLDPPGRGDREACMLVHPSMLLTALVALFEAYWSHGSALRLGEVEPDPANAIPPGIPEDGLAIVALMFAGVPNGRIAQRLGVSERTVDYRIAKARDAFGVPNSYQLVAKAHKLGLV